MKKLISVILIGALIIGTGTAVYAENGNNQLKGNTNYTDLKSTSWAYEAVNTMSQKGIVKGYQDGSFKPGNVVTYGEFIKMALVAATGQDVGNASAVNTQTGAKQNWAQSYYNKALELKYFGSTDIKVNQLEHQIPRSDMALIISSILGETKIENYDELQSSLKDVNAEVNHDYDIIKSYASGIITGYEDNTFRPDKTLTRAESATVIYRLIDESKRVLPLEKKEIEVKTNVDEVIQNSKSFLDDSKNIDSYLSHVTCYRIVQDATPYNFVLKQKYGNGINTTWFDSVNIGRAYLMKDNKIVESLSDDPNQDKSRSYSYHVDITQMDYIVSVPSNAYNAENGETVAAILIVNPFKK